MPSFAQRFRVNKKQAQLDFVDIDPDRDTPLFVDPFALSIREDIWSTTATDLIYSFFQEAIDSIRRGDRVRAQALLGTLSEPNETCLGLSKERPRGRGVSGKQAFDLYTALATSEAARTGELSELADCDLFVFGIGADKISDITTNIIRGSLIEYTQDQCRLHGIPLEEAVPSGRMWDPIRLTWIEQYVELPVIGGEKILLVPKATVRRRMSLDSQEYYNHHVLSFLQAEHLAADSALVEVLKNKRRRVTKKKLKTHHPFDKDFLLRITREHPGLLETYKRIKGAEGALRNRDFDRDFDESVFCTALIDQLHAVPPGNGDASNFHRLMIGALEFIFYPNLIIPKKELEIDEGRKRIDISFTNAARDGFFYRAHTAHQIASNVIMVECKNYSSDIANPELDQLTGRFSVNRGRLGLLISRSFDNRALFVARCRDAAQAGRGFVIPLIDEDLIRILTSIRDGGRRFVDEYLEGIFRQLIA
jgi:hypothetical protein